MKNSNDIIVNRTREIRSASTNCATSSVIQKLEAAMLVNKFPAFKKKQ